MRINIRTKEELVNHVPQLRKELDILVHNYTYLKKNIDFLNDFKKSHNINSEKEMNEFLNVSDPIIKENLSAKNPLKIVDSPATWDKFSLQQIIEYTNSMDVKENDKYTLEFLKNYFINHNISLDQKYSGVEKKIFNNKFSDLDLNSIHVKAYYFLDNLTCNISKAREGNNIPLKLFPTELLINAILEIKNIEFNQNHDLNANFLLLDYSTTLLKKYISQKIQNNEEFEWPIILTLGDHFEPALIKYQNNILTFFHIGDDADLFDLFSKNTNVEVKAFHCKNLWQSDIQSCFVYAITGLKHMIEDSRQNNITFHNFTEDHSSKIIISKLKDKDLIYFKHAQSLSLINKIIEQKGNIEYKPGSKLSDILNNSTIVVEEEDGQFHAKAMNFSIYESAYNLYTKTKEWFDNSTDEQIADVILSHRLPEDYLLNLTGENFADHVQ